jgi:hypothetical protein
MSVIYKTISLLDLMETISEARIIDILASYTCALDYIFRR